MTDKDENYDVVRIQKALLPLIDKLIDEDKDHFGTQNYRSRQVVVSQAVKEFLDKRLKEIKVQ